MEFNPQIEFTHQLTSLLERISSKKSILDNKRPFSATILKKLKEDFTVEWTYNSNHIEGNTLTLSETKVILEDGVTIGGKSLREHFEVVNHQKAIAYLEFLLDNNKSIRSIDLLKVHEIVLANIQDDYSGRLRQGMVRIVGANFTPPNAKKVPDLLDELVDYINCNPMDYHFAILAAIFHHRFVWIHPFNDGNGRTVRLAMNLILMAQGYPPSFILTRDRKQYINALNSANKGNYNKLILIILQSIERSLNIYISSLSSDYEDYLPTADIASDPEVPYGQEYLSLLARRGRIDAYKEGRAWLTTKSAVKNYQKTKLK